MLRILSSLLNLQSCQVDYTQAFPQAMLDNLVYMWVSDAWHVDNGTLKQHNDPILHELMGPYGYKQAVHNWFRHLTKDLIQCGFTQFRTDNCLFSAKIALHLLLMP